MPTINFEPQQPKFVYVSVQQKKQSTPTRINFYLLVYALKIQKLRSRYGTLTFFVNSDKLCGNLDADETLA